MSKSFIETSTSKRDNAWKIDPLELVVIGVDTPHRSDAEHPLFDARALEPLDPAMVANIGTIGVLEPILVDRDEEGRVLVVDGRRRVLHAREANRRCAERGEPTILVPIYADSIRRGSKTSDEDRWMSAMVSANEIRRDDSILNRATKAKAMAARGVDTATIANRFGVGESQIKAWLVLAGASSEIKAAVASGKLIFTKAVAIAKRPLPLQRRELEKATQGGKRLTGRQVDAASGRTVAPTRRDLRNLIASVTKRRDELAKDGHNDALLDAAAELLNYVYVGGVVPTWLRTLLEPKAVTRTAAKAAPAAPQWDATDEAILTHGLTDRATKVVDLSATEDGDEAVTTIAGRMEAAGYCVADDELSARLVRLSRAGKCERAIGGYRRNKA